MFASAKPLGVDMDYWVYINRPNKKVRLHKSTCGACKNGIGMHSFGDPNISWWVGSFDSRDDAWNYAQKYATELKTQPSTCLLCNP